MSIPLENYKACGPRAQKILDKQVEQEYRALLRVQQVEAIQSQMVKRPLTPEQEAARKRFHTPISELRRDPVAAPQVAVWMPNVSKRCPQSIGCQCGLSICRMAR